MHNFLLEELINKLEIIIIIIIINNNNKDTNYEIKILYIIFPGVVLCKWCFLLLNLNQYYLTDLNFKPISWISFDVQVEEILIFSVYIL